MNFTDIAAIRLQNQKLLDVKLNSPEEVVRWLGAVQSQDFPGARWALNLRLKNSRDEAIMKLYDDGNILRTHVMRPTWHFVLRDDIRWMLDLTAPRVKKLMAYYDRKLDIDQKVIHKVEELFEEALAGSNYLTRAELEKVLDAGGIKAHGQKLGHVVGRAELDQVICNGPMRGKQFTYGLVSERAPNAKKLSHDEALAELAKRYFQSHGPALIADFAWWSGLTMTESSKGANLAELQNEIVGGKTYWFKGSTFPPKLNSPLIQLLPNYDEYLISYKDYSPIFSGEVKKLDNQFGNALVNHLITRDGLVVGGWRRLNGKNEVTVETNLLVKFNKSEEALVKVEAEKLSQFLNLPVKVTSK